MADDKDKNVQQAPAVDNTSPEEKALADKLMAELMASGVDVNALAAKTPVTTPAGGPVPAPATPPAPAPTPAAPPPKPDAPSPSPSTSSGPAASTSSGPLASTSSGPAAPAPKPTAPVPTSPPPPPPAPTPAAPVLPVTPAPASQPIASPTSTQDVESFIQSLDSTLARLNDSQFFVIRISKPVFYILTAVLGLLLIVVPRLPR